MQIGDSRDFILKWNEDFPLDHWWRQKHKIQFNSLQHRSVSYIDIFYEWLEDNIYEDYFEDQKQLVDRFSEFKKDGKWLRPNNSIEQKQEMIEIFDNLDLSGFNDHLMQEADEKEDIEENSAD